MRRYREMVLEALALARESMADPAGGASDIPVAAVVFDSAGNLLATGRNQRAGRVDPTAHAEIVAIRGAARALGTWRLDGCTIAVTLEPCPMCAGAIAAGRMQRLVFGAWNPDYGAAGSLVDVLRDPRLPHRVEVVGGILEQECADLLSEYFARLRISEAPPS